jgi:hypothetical protein
MRITRALVAAVTTLVVVGSVGSLSFPIRTFAEPARATSNVAVGAQYDTTHVYVAPADFDTFVASLVATFGGTTSKKGVFTVTPTPSETMSQLVLTPVGTLSVFGFETPIPYPFGSERTGYLVTDMESAIRVARATGADILVSTFKDPINGRVVSTRNYTGIPPHHPMRLSRASRKTVFTFLHMQWALSCAAFVPSLTAKLFQMMSIRLALKSDVRVIRIAESGCSRNLER